MIAALFMPRWFILLWMLVLVVLGVAQERSAYWASELIRLRAEKRVARRFREA